MGRKYQLKKRAERQEETRRRIVEAAIDLHGTIGPARTTVSAIAERAGVQRHTYYRHFPDDRSLFTACSGLYTERNPPPDPERWREIRDPDERLGRALRDLYTYYAANEPMFSNVMRDAEVHPLTAEANLARFAPVVAAMRDVLGAGRRSKRALALIDLAIAFPTWRMLAASGLATNVAADTMAAAVRCASSG